MKANRLIALAALAMSALAPRVLPNRQSSDRTSHYVGPLELAVSGAGWSSRNGNGRRTGALRIRRAAQKHRNRARHRKACR